MNEKEVTNLNGTATEDRVVDGPQQAKPEGCEREGPAAAAGAAGFVAADAGDGAGAGGALSDAGKVLSAEVERRGCPVPGCLSGIPLDHGYLMCRVHWRQLPGDLQVGSTRSTGG